MSIVGLICDLCNRPITGRIDPDRSTDGRVAHWHCSDVAFKQGTWQSKPVPVFNIVEDGDDERALYELLGYLGNR